VVPVDVPILSDLANLRATCFAKDSKTCVIEISDEPIEAVGEVYLGLLARPSLQVFQVYRLEGQDELAKLLQQQLQLGSELPQMVALNHKGWFRLFNGNIKKPLEILDWLDAVKLGDLPKGKIPDEILGVQEEKMAEEKDEKQAEKQEKQEEEPPVENEEKKDEIKDEL
jgi:protein disulfide-isomerase A6